MFFNLFYTSVYTYSIVVIENSQDNQTLLINYKWYITLLAKFFSLHNWKNNGKKIHKKKLLTYSLICIDFMIFMKNVLALKG